MFCTLINYLFTIIIVHVYIRSDNKAEQADDPDEDRRKGPLAVDAG